MLISTSRGFLFIELPHCGGAEVRRALQSCTDLVELDAAQPSRGLFMKLFRSDRHRSRNVATRYRNADTLTRCVPLAERRSLYRFSFVRNPWDLLFRFYQEIRASPDHALYEPVSEMGLEEFIPFAAKLGLGCQLDQLSARDSTLLVDFVGRWESHEDDLATVMRCLEISSPLPGRTPVEDDFRYAYSPVAVSLVGRCYSRDIDAFGYSFETSGKKIAGQQTNIRRKSA